MKVISVCAVEDDKQYQLVLKELIQNVSYRTTITFFDSAEDFLQSDNFFDLILLDIDLPKMNGIQLSRRIMDRTDRIVYMTSHSERMQEAFGYKVVGFILKTMKEKDIINSLNAICSAINPSTIELETIDGIVSFPLNNIYRIATDRPNLMLWTKNSKIQIFNTSLSEVKKKLNQSFIYANKSCLVNLSHVLTIQEKDQVIFDNGEIEYLSRRRKKGFSLEFMQRVSKL